MKAQRLLLGHMLYILHREVCTFTRYFFFLIHPCLHLAAAAPVTNDKALLVIFRRMFISFTAGRKQHLSFEALHHSCDPDLRHPPPALSAVLPLSLFPFLLPGDIHVSEFDGMLLLLPP